VVPGVKDMAPICCEKWGVEVRKDRPCLYFQGLLLPEECVSILSTLGLKHDISPTGFESGVRSQFSYPDPDLSKKIYSRISPFLPSHLDGGDAIGLRIEWNHARYFPGQSVFAHMDQRQSSIESSNDPCIASRMSLNVYLDNDYTGGEFIFVSGTRDDGTWEHSHTVLHPKAGDAVIFYQAVPEFSHSVPSLKSGTKTIMRSDVMYRFSSKEQADVGGRLVEGGRKK